MFVKEKQLQYQVKEKTVGFPRQIKLTSGILQYAFYNDNKKKQSPC